MPRPAIHARTQKGTLIGSRARRRTASYRFHHVNRVERMRARKRDPLDGKGKIE